MSVFGKVTNLAVSNVTNTGFHVSWSPPSTVYPEALADYDVAVSKGSELGTVVYRTSVPTSGYVPVTGLTTGYAEGTEYIVGVRAQKERDGREARGTHAPALGRIPQL